ncbi:flagellar type III secretion system protein FlhB [Listeria monocytogenes]|uniref:flagellar type III secretion system protein FlhB n=1 Tax=Listeria monocytogenes TaxID=1639 RepID=UPI0008755389|nr:flagellar biosynthesis protein FlhB [Listeria monocytogenes]EAE0904498.1 flagellar type III secretion system protein FlhB [Listeria monocytogenes]EAE3603305.1 flagellar type III secretion system protein FlhB [Listeria monocytogenes]EAE3634820.1 flagellar type III secretion system protein FlhB [Listeria monocytogenes]EAE3640954.1 flagellar type III secretion system protein FlhB [Listeria monocytogenes]EAE3647758.1 flagellar type III secretion system protein FlhB [Listeria monocytogenes]
MAKDNKTEKATPRRIKKARNEGNVAKSKELNNAFSLLIVAGLLYFFGEMLIKNTIQAFVALLKQPPKLANMESYSLFYLMEFGKVLMPIMVMVVIFGLMNYGVQVGILFSAKAVKPQFKRLNPANYFKRVFSVKGIVEVVKALLLITLLSYVAYIGFRDHLDTLISYTGQNWLYSLGQIFALFKNEFLALFLVIAVIGLLDFFYQRYDYKKGLRMSKQEIKDEMKDSEGRPEVKQRQRSIARGLLQGSITKKMADATFVVNNPTHISVVMRYDKTKDHAPKLLVKGEDELALFIRQVADTDGVPMITNRQLARSIYYTTNPDEYIQEDLYKDVIEVMKELMDADKIKF